MTLFRSTLALCLLAPSIVLADPIISIDPDDTSATYTLVDDGLTGGAQSYTDDTSFTWQGATSMALPAFLEGADYVQTANGDDSNSDFSIEITFSQPSDLFVFHSDGVDDPDWLTTDFVDTGSDLRRVNSVIGFWSVWERSFTGSGSTTYTLLDNDPNTTNSDEMYGIAAKAISSTGGGSKGGTVVPAPASTGLLIIVLSALGAHRARGRRGA